MVQKAVEKQPLLCMQLLKYRFVFCDITLMKMFYDIYKQL